MLFQVAQTVDRVGPGTAFVQRRQQHTRDRLIEQPETAWTAQGNVPERLQ